MGSRGRQSKAEIATAATAESAEVVAIERPKPPAHLPDDAKEVWDTIVADQAADHFHDSSLTSLEFLCGHICNARRIAQLLEHEWAQKELDTAAIDQYLKWQTAESRIILSYKTRLRLTHQSTVSPRKPKHGRRPTTAPWEDVDDDEG